MKQKSNSKSKSKSTGSKAPQNYNSQSHQPTENAWSRSRHSSVSDMWSDADEHFPALGASAAPGPTVNVWEARKSKQEAIKALEPQNELHEQAMLDYALSLSLAAAEEEQLRMRVEEEYKLQLEALECYPQDLDENHAVDRAVGGRTSKRKDNLLVEEQHELKNCSRSSVSNNNEKKIYDYDESEFRGDIPVEKEYQSENYSRNSSQNNCQKGKIFNSGGARPKVSKAIEAFGGWGLKENKKRNNSEKISTFVDDVVSEKPLEKFNSYNKTPDDQKNKYINTIENVVNSIQESSLHNADDKDEIFYDEKGTFLDDYDDGNWGNSPKNEAVDLPSVSPNKVLDTWLCSEDSTDGNNEVLNEVPTCDDKETDNFITPTFSDEPKIEDDKNKTISPIPTIFDDYEPEMIKNSQIFSQSTSESIKNVWSNTTNYRDQEPEDTFKNNGYDVNDNSFTPFHEPTEVPTLTTSNIWSDKSSSSSSYLGSFSDSLVSKVESVKISNDTDNEVFKGVSLSNDSDVPPIPPPQPATAISSSNEYSTPAPVITDNDCKVESPIMPQPQVVPQMPVPQFPVMGNPMLTPMFPAINPMLGCGMDPLLMRRMLILSNPFLANQLLAMEQYYRSMGVPVDLFCMTNPMANMPGVLNPPHLQNSFASNVNNNIQQLQSEIQQLQVKIDENSASMNGNIENHEQKSFEVSHQPSGLDFNNSSPPEHSNDDPWYKSYLPSDNASIIPPPKPPPSEINSNNMPLPQKSESNLVGSSFDNKLAHSHSSDNSVVYSSNGIKKPPAGYETSGAIKESSGWCDPEDDLADAQNLKSYTWADGWRQNTTTSPKPVRNPSIQEDKKKTVFRQPAKQPQIGRYQRNSTYS